MVEVAAAATSLAAEAAAWQKRDFGSGGSALGSAAAAQRWQLQIGQRHDVNQSL